MAYATDYDVDSYGRMLSHEARVEGYVQAIRAAVRPGDVVMDLGTGTGFMALIACQCGAQRVHAIEPTSGILLAQRAAQANGFADRIVFHRAHSRQVQLRERCDVLISDLRGATPFFSSHLTDLIEVRERLLKPDARWICQTDTLFVAATDIVRREEQPLAQWDGTRFGLDLRSALPFATQQMMRRRSEPEELLGPAQAWTTVNYPTLTSPNARGSTRLPITRHGVAHGLVVWMGIELFGGVRFSNAPGQPPGVYSPVFLPWPQAVALQTGDIVDVRIDAVSSGHDYWWSWSSTVRHPGEADPRASFRQSTFQGRIFDRAETSVGATLFTPTLSPAGEEVRFVLGCIDGRTSQAGIAAALRAQFPARFGTDDAALARVTEIRRSHAA